MRKLEVDANGWAIGAVSPLAIEEAWTLLSPEAEARVDAGRWAHQAATFFRAKLSLAVEKRYPSGTVPIADALEIDIARRDDEATTRVLVITLPADRARFALKAGVAGATAIGGAGFDALVPRTRRVWQVAHVPRASGDERAPLAAAAVLASVFLAPIVPPGGGTIFGVKGARQRLESLGWRT